MTDWPDPWTAGATAFDIALASHGPPAGLAMRRRRRYQALVAAARGTPFWRERFARHGESLEAQPPVGKRALMDRFEDTVIDPVLRLADLRAFVADPSRVGERFANRYTVWESSGSSGVPGLYVQDAGAMAVYDALELLRRPSAPGLQRWLDPMRAGGRVAFVGATGGHFASTVSVERLRRDAKVMADRLRSFSFLVPPPELDAALLAWRPDVIATYPTQAAVLADEAEAGRLPMKLREIWTGGEALGAGLRSRLTRVFGAAVHASYGSSEFLALACECDHGHLHLNADWAILEPVDEHGVPVPDGEVGASVLLTNLANLVQPLIRYDLGDRVRIDPRRCDCGSPLPVIEVQGRVDDSLRLGTGRHTHRLPPLALSTVLEDDAGAFDFLLEQTGPSALRLTLPPASTDAALARAQAALEAYLRTQGVEQARLEVQRGATAPAARSGKRARIVRLGMAVAATGAAAGTVHHASPASSSHAPAHAPAHAPTPAPAPATPRPSTGKTPRQRRPPASG